MNPWRYITDRLPFGNNLPISIEKVECIRRQTGAEEWHTEAIAQRSTRLHVTIATRWLAECIPTGGKIIEPGCGSGANLFWLALNAGHHIFGADISNEALAMAQQLAIHFGVQAEFWHDDGINPSHLPQDMDGIVSVNWLYHIPGVTLEQFLTTYRVALKPNGFIAFDMVTRDYDQRPGNHWHTEDQNLPLEQRRPSEYRIRMDKEEVQCIAYRCGFALLRSTRFLTCNPQRAVHLLRRVA